MKIGIINSGGDTQSINAVIASAVISGIKEGHKFVGFIKGWEGLLDREFMNLDLNAVRGISHLGGTILHSVNKGRFAGKAGAGNFNEIPDEIIKEAITSIKDLGIDALIVIGGDGTLSAAKQLANEGIKVIGVPKTIDNDLDEVDQTFGLSTAVDIVVEALDRIHTTAFSHDRVIFVETMGRNVGWIALHSGLAGGADIILIPEIEFNYQGLVNHLKYRKRIGRNYSIVVVSEGAKPKEGTISAKVIEGQPEVKLAGVTDQIMGELERLAPGEFEMRNVVLGHIQRGGTPNAEDRILGKAYGVAAFDAIKHEKFGTVVCLKNNEMIHVPIDDVIDRLKVVDFNSVEFKTAKSLGVYFGE